MEGPGDETFGTLLKFFRERRQLKQVALAYRIGKRTGEASMPGNAACTDRKIERRSLLLRKRSILLSVKPTNSWRQPIFLLSSWSHSQRRGGTWIP
jgi:hypothetical protein